MKTIAITRMDMPTNKKKYENEIKIIFKTINSTNENINST